MNILDKIGARFLARMRFFGTTVSVLGGVLLLAAHRRNWARTVRAVAGRQVLFTGVEAMGLALTVAFLVGVSVVAQAQLWLSRFGQSEMLGRLLVAVIVDGAGPLLVNLIVIARSGTAIATELATMRVRGETEVLEALGVDPMVYLVLPRVVGVLACVFALTVLFVICSFVSGYLAGLMLGANAGDPGRFARGVFEAATPDVAVGLVAKTALPGLLTGTICCVEGLSVRGAATEVPQAGTRAVVRSLTGAILITAVVSVLILI